MPDNKSRVERGPVLHTLDKKIAVAFCEQCRWVHETWTTYRVLFDENKKPKETFGAAMGCANILHEVMFDYVILQIAKLHDPAFSRKRANLTIKYIVESDDWGNEKLAVEYLCDKLLPLGEALKSARDKILSHSDIETMQHGVPLGAFSEGMDVEYFGALQALVNKVHEKWVGTAFSLKSFARRDATVLLKLLAIGSAEQSRATTKTG